MLPIYAMVEEFIAYLIAEFIVEKLPADKLWA